MTRAFKFGKSVFQDLSGLVMLNAVRITANYYYVFKDAVTQANYQVPAGKTLVITQILFNTFGSASRYDKILYGDNVSTGSGTPPTNTIFLTQRLRYAAHSILYKVNVLCQVPENKYLHAFGSSNSSDIHILGKEV